LKEIEEQMGPEMIEEMTQKEKNFRNMLSDIKLKSENMRKKKMHQAQTTQKMMPAKGQPSFMTVKDSQIELE
jgi:hypothetical protein